MYVHMLLCVHVWLDHYCTYSIMHACAVHCVCVIMMHKKKGFGALKAVGTQHMCMCMCMYMWLYMYNMCPNLILLQLRLEFLHSVGQFQQFD